MKLLVAPDKFKGSLTAKEAAEAIAAGVGDACGKAPSESTTRTAISVEIHPLADGGDGSAEILCEATRGQAVVVRCHDPLGRQILARYCLSVERGRRVAFVESAAASGLHLLRPDELDPRRASSFGTGELVRHAFESGASDVVVLVGGTATLDVGLGFLLALGVQIRDSDGEVLGPFDELLFRAATLDISISEKYLRRSVPRLVTATDVDNPLLGPEGAVSAFGPQKGVALEDVGAFESAVARIARLYAAVFGRDPSALPRMGAGGGLPAAPYALWSTPTTDGFIEVATRSGFYEMLEETDIVATGEGRLDPSSLHGKVVGKVLTEARRRGIRVVVFAGSIDPATGNLGQGVEAISLERYAHSMQESVDQAAELLRRAAEEWAWDLLKPRDRK